VLKKTLLAVGGILVLVVAGLAVFRVLGLRVAVDGSGMMPRFVSRAPDFDALEADRARQRAEGERRAPAPVEAPASGADAVAPAISPAGAADSATPSAPAARATWPDFRGASRDGVYRGPAILTDWPASGLPLMWKQPIGLGYASFVVADGRAFTIEQRRDQEVVAAYDVETGRELWTNSWDAAFSEAMGGDGPRATPTYHEGSVYALGALGELRSLDARTGAVRWRRNILTDAGAENLTWGMSGAPLVVDGTVIVLPGGTNGRSVAAYDTASGKPVWHALDDQQAYTSPMLVTLAGERQVVFATASRVVGIAPDHGRLLWEFPWTTMNGINAAQPLLLGNDRVLISSSYGQGAAVFEVTRAGAGFAVKRIWESNRLKTRFTSPLLHEGFVYGLDESILACIDPATGELKWKGGRYGYGQVLLAGDRLIVLTEEGEVVQVRATPDRHEEIARFQAIDGKTWNHPVIADGRLLVRNLREMAAFDITGQ
jgi:outer membrane protein assembly factor BamB